MIKIKANTKELKYFAEYLDECIERPKTIDLVKEYFIAFAVNQLCCRIKEKVFKQELKQLPFYTAINLKIEDNEILALSFYFNRYPVHTFLNKVEQSILKQMPSEIIKVIEPRL